MPATGRLPLALVECKVLQSKIFFSNCATVKNIFVLLRSQTIKTYTIMKRIFLLLMAVVPLFAYSQDAKEATKFEVFSSKTGSIMKYIDTNMPALPLNWGSLQTSVRTVMSDQGVAYFYRIERAEMQSLPARTAMIEYSDLVEINKALGKLVASVSADLQSNPDYLENKFITEDGFQIGYYVSSGKANWYMKLEKYTSSTVFVKNSDVLISAFSGAQQKIEELKAQQGN